MQILMLFLEVLVVVLILAEGFMRLRSYLQARKQRAPAVSSGPDPASLQALAQSRHLKIPSLLLKNNMLYAAL